MCETNTMNKCKCGSYAINHHMHGRGGSHPELCDVCYWRRKYTDVLHALVIANQQISELYDKQHNND